MKRLRIPVSPGELVDKITILEIKSERLTDPQQLRNVTRELGLLRRELQQPGLETPVLQRLADQLREVNSELWRVEDDLRERERHSDFGASFIASARAVYQHNDRRAEIKRRINIELESDIVEEKSYCVDS